MKKPGLQEVRWFTQNPIAFQCSACLYHGLLKKVFEKGKRKQSNISLWIQIYCHLPINTFYIGQEGGDISGFLSFPPIIAEFKEYA